MRLAWFSRFGNEIENSSQQNDGRDKEWMRKEVSKLTDSRFWYSNESFKEDTIISRWMKLSFKKQHKLESILPLVFQ